MGGLLWVLAGVVFTTAAPVLAYRAILRRWLRGSYLRGRKRQRIVRELRQSDPKGLTVLQPIVTSSALFDLATLCSHCLGTGFAFMPHSDQGRETCTCEHGKALAEALRVNRL